MKLKMHLIFQSLTLLAFVVPLQAQDSTEIIPAGDPAVPAFVDASVIELYKDTNAWFGSNTVESVLQDEYGLVIGGDIGIHPTSDLAIGISADTRIVIITANDRGFTSTHNNINNPAAQANLRAFVENGGCLVMHLADNFGAGSFIAPGLSQAPGVPSGNDMNLVAPAGHPVRLGLDGIAGTADDLTQSNIQWTSSCCAHHGVLPGLPQNATVLLETNQGQPIWAEYSLGSGTVLVSALTSEFSAFPRIFTISEMGFALGACLNSPPVANAGADQTAECVDGAAIVELDGSASSDPDGDALSFEWTAPAGVVLSDPTLEQPTGIFPVGITLVTLTVSDGNGGIDTADVLITVEDTTPPAISCTTDIVTLWPPNHKMEWVTVYIPVSDACVTPDDLLLLSVTASSSELDDANGVGDGETTGDVNGLDGNTSSVEIQSAFEYDPQSMCFVGGVFLRTERSGTGYGRSYTIEASVGDPAGNISNATCVVVVPKNKKKK